MGLNCIGQLIHKIFSVNTTKISHDQLLAEFVDAEMKVQRTVYDVMLGFHCSRVNCTYCKRLIFTVYNILTNLYKSSASVESYS